MPAPTYAEASGWANRSDNFGSALKTPERGGPFRKVNAGANEYADNPEFAAEHPRYPDYHYPDDKARDTYYQFKRQMVGAGGPFGKVQSTDRDIQYLMDKKNAQELSLFKQFVEDSIPRGTPWAKDYFERFMPGWYQSKIDIIQDKLSIINRFIDITVRGPQNIEDMFLLYQLYAGKIELPTNWQDLIKGTDANTLPENEFSSGLFCPKKWISQSIRYSHRNQKYLANFAIPGIDQKGAYWPGRVYNAEGLDEEMEVSGGIVRDNFPGRAADGDRGSGFFGKHVLTGSTSDHGLVSGGDNIPVTGNYNNLQTGIHSRI